MLKLTALLGATTCVALCLPLAVRSEDVDSHLLRAYSQFELANGQTEKVPTPHHSHRYRICVRTSRYEVPVKVMHDGLTTLVHPGDCEDFAGAKIAISPGGRLAQDTVLLGHYWFLG